jgi:hypothetical protein
MTGFEQLPEIEWHLPDEVPDDGEYVILILKTPYSDYYTKTVKLIGAKTTVYKTVCHKFRFKSDWAVFMWTAKDIEFWGRLKTN